MTSNKYSIINNLTSALKSQTKAQKRLFLLYTFLFIPQSILILRSVGVRLGLSAVAPFFGLIFTTITFLICFKSITRQIRFNDIVFIIAIVVIYFASALIFPATAPYSIDNASYFFLTCLPMYFVGLTIKQDTSREMFVILAYLALILQIVFLSVLGMGVNEEGEELNELMTTAYSFLPFVLFLLWYAFEHGGIWSYVFALIGVFILMALGTRGPILCMIAFIALFLLFFKRFKRNLLIKTLIVLLAGVFLLFSNEIVFFLGHLAQSLGLSTRVFDSFIQNEMININESNGRDDIWNQTFSYLIKNKVLLGEGLYSDRIINGTSQYSHNFELELFCTFGLLGGLIIIFLLTRIIYRAFKKVRGIDCSIIVLIFFCSSIIQLQFSGSFLKSKVFWFFLGICISMNRSPIIKREGMN